MRAPTSMREGLCGLLVPAVLLAVASSCQGPGPTGGTNDVVGTAQIALTNVPADGTCVSVTAAGTRTVTRSFGAAAGTSAVFEMGGLPLGQVTFTADAFSGDCPPAAGTVPTWISDAAFTATIAVDPPALVTLNLIHNGSANVVIGFDDGADGGTSSDGGGVSGSGGASGGSHTFMKVDGVAGPETAPAVLDWFDLESFDLDTTTPVSTGAGAGAGASKTTWSVSGTLRYQQGVPDLYAAGSAGKAIKTVEFAVVKGDLSSPAVYLVTLTNALVSSIVASPPMGDVAPELKITFVFTSIKFELTGGTNADGTTAPSTIATFNLATGAGVLPPNPPVALTFVVGGPATPALEAVDSFHAPSETTSASTAATGAGAGKTTFGDATVTLPVDTTVLDMLLEEVAGTVTRTGSVQIDATGPAGPAAFGSYGFSGIRIDGVSFSNLEATVSFTATSLTWSVGSDTGKTPATGGAI
jgi:type VI protein secretion system component Hcp